MDNSHQFNKQVGQMSQQFLDQNVTSSAQPVLLFANPTLLPSNQQSSDVDDELNRELAQLRHHFTMLTSKSHSVTDDVNSGPTPPPFGPLPTIPTVDNTPSSILAQRYLFLQFLKS